MQSKKPLHFVTALLLLSTAITFFAGCKKPISEEENSQNETRPRNTETVEPEAYPDLNGETFIFHTCTSAVSGFETSNLFVEGTDDKKAHPVSQTAYSRNMFIQEKLNTDIQYVQNDMRYEQVGSYYQNLFLADDSVDLVINKLYPLATMSINGLFTNVANNNAFDFYSGYWYTEYMNSLSLDDGNTCYLLAGDYFIDVLRASGLLIYNDKLFDDLYSADGGSVTLEQTVYDGNWTMELFLQYVNETYRSNGGGSKSPNDQYGFLSSQIWYNGITSFVGAADLHYVSEDRLRLEMNNDRSLYLLDSLKNLYYGEGCVPFKRLPGTKVVELAFEGTPMNLFGAGKGLFLGQMRFANMEQLTNVEHWAVLPYPKLDDTQSDYVTPSDELTEVGAIPRRCAKKERLLTLLEYLNRTTAETVMSDYYSACLQYRYSKTPEMRKMVIFIHDHIRGAFEQAYNNYVGNNFMWNPFYVPVLDELEFTSSYRKAEKEANSQLERMMNNWERYMEN